MADSRFYQKAEPIAAHRLAEIVEARLPDDAGDIGDLHFADIASLQDATPDCISFLSNPKARPAAC